MKLYDIAEEYKILEDMLYDGETDEQTIRDTMEAVLGEFEEKADNYAKIIFQMKSDIEVLEKEEKRLSAKRKVLESRQKWLRDNLFANMQAIGKKKFKTALFSFTIQKNGGVEPLIIDGLLEDIPGKFLIPQPPVPNKEAIREFLSEKQVEWAHLEPRGESLRIR